MDAHYLGAPTKPFAPLAATWQHPPVGQARTHSFIHTREAGWVAQPAGCGAGTKRLAPTLYSGNSTWCLARKTRKRTQVLLHRAQRIWPQGPDDPWLYLVKGLLGEPGAASYSVEEVLLRFLPWGRRKEPAPPRMYDDCPP